MKFELKTDNQNHSKSFGYFFGAIFCLSLIIVFCDLILKIGIISKNYQIENNCRLLSIEKTTSNFKKLSKLLNLKSRQQIWEFCKKVIK